MTTYAHDREQSHLLAVWPTGIGHTATVVATTPADHNTMPLIDELCDALTDLSAAVWDTYTQPVSAATDDNEQHARQAEKDAFTEVNEAIHTPDLPDETGLLSVSYIRVQECAHRVGRVLHRLQDPTLTEAISAEAARDTSAVEQAERGELTGRAAQATTLDRVDVSPAQVAAADTLFAREPRGSDSLLTTLDPAAACVAAAHWLSASARVTAQIAEVDAPDVFAESDNINACSIQVPQLVVETVLGLEQPPRAIVLRLLTEATQAREGKIPNLERLLAHVNDAHLEAEEFPESRRAEVLDALLPDRITPLDPQRPARDLLEHLLDGLRASLTLFHTSIDTDEDGEPAIHGQPIPHPEGATWNRPEDDYDDPDYINALNEALNHEFNNRVRDEAARTHDRLI